MGCAKPNCFLFLIIIIIIIFFISFNLDSASAASELCLNSSCRRTEPVIRFPFHLHSLQPSSCGFPGFELFCGAVNQTLVDLPNSGRFTVESIDYAKQNIWINDPENCLPKRLLELNLTGSPFNGFFFQDFTLFNCSFDHRNYKLEPITCLSGENYTVYASSSERAIRYLASTCRLVATVAVPVEWEYFEPVTTSDLGDNIKLKWGSPRCWRCESRGGHCGYRSANSSAIECMDAARQGMPRSARYAIIVGAGLPTFLFLLGFLCYLCSRIHHLSRRHHPVSAMVVPHPTTTIISGLDDPTIRSFPKTILGESCRLPKPDDSICSICLSEYLPKEILRTIPECQHCFHVDCIDEWLRLNASCPVCRNSPMSSPLPLTHPS